jgi:hypothetical protein
VAHPLGFEKEGKGADQAQAGDLGSAPCRTVVEDDRVSADFEGQPRK